jgi:hypothetical protein
MKKLFILTAAVALMAMTACNEKPAKEGEQLNAPATEQIDTANGGQAKPKIDVEKAAPTADGKDHVVAEFNTKEYQMRLENLADGTYRVSMWKAGQDKSGTPEKLAESKKCVMKDGGYLMKTDDGTIYVINTKAGAENITIMNDKGIVYNGNAVK